MENLPINEEFLQQLELLQLLIKNSVAGAFGGNHKTRTYGSSCEYADFRDYVPGDDLKKVDWNAYARFEKLYLKLFLDERQMHTRIYIDASRSMTYGNGNKDTQAVKIAAAIAYLSVCDMDKVSIYVIHENAVEEVITSMLGKDSFVANIGKLNGIVFNGDSCISDAVLPLNVGYSDGLSVIISDFLTDNNYEDAVNYLADRKRDVLCVQVLSREELKPKSRGKVHFFDSENTSRYYRKNINRDIINAYKAALEYATGRIRDLCHSREAEYMLVAADENIADLFFERMTEMGVLK